MHSTPGSRNSLVLTLAPALAIGCCGCSVYEGEGDDTIGAAATTTTPPEQDPGPEPFGVEFEPGECTIVANDLRFLDSSTGTELTDVPATWTGCWADWASDYDGAQFFSLRLMAPGTSGNRVLLGPRWFAVSTRVDPFSSTRATAVSFVDGDDDDPGTTIVRYVDSDDEAAVAGSSLDDPAYDVTVSGQIEASAIDGEVTCFRGDGFLPDDGTADLTIDVGGVVMTLLDGRSVDVEGSVTVSGTKGTGCAGGSAGGDDAADAGSVTNGGDDAADAGDAGSTECETFNDMTPYYGDIQANSFCLQAGLYRACGQDAEADMVCGVLAALATDSGAACPYC